MAETNESVKRQVAQKILISELVNSSYVKKEGWDSNYFDTVRGKVSRANIIATVISKEEGDSYNTLIVDDGTGSISLKAFENKDILNNKRVGSVVQIIGRPREFNNEKYLVPEAVSEIDKQWFFVRQKELGRQAKITKTQETVTHEKMPALEKPKTVPKAQEIKVEEVSTNEEHTNPYQQIMQLIINMDEGRGVPIDEVILSSKIKNAEEIINSLIEEGEIFQLRPGILKAL